MPGNKMEELTEVLLTHDNPSEYFEELRRTDSLDQWFPELKALIGVPQNILYHIEGDTWTHTMMVLDEASKRRDIAKFPLGFMLSALCHDFGKAVSTSVSEDGTLHSYNHETEGLPLVQTFLERLSTGPELTKYVLNMTELHMEPNTMARARSKLKKTNKLFDSSVEPFDLIQLALCDGLGKLPQCADTEPFLMERYEDFRRIMSRPFMTANDLEDAGVPANEELLSYAHKLRLAGIDKDGQLRQTIAYARSVLKMKVPEK